MALSENTKKVLDYVKEHDGDQFTANDIAEVLGLNPRSVNGTITALQRKGFVARVPAEIELTTEEGKTVTKKINFIELTDEGREFDPEAVSTPTAE